MKIRKILLVLLSLMMIISMMPMGAAIAFAEDAQADSAEPTLTIANQQDADSAEPLLTIANQQGTDGDAVEAPNHVCYFEDMGENIYFTSLEAAIASSSDWTTIYLLKDIETKTIEIAGTEGHYLEINLGNHTITGTSDKGIVFAVKGKTTLYLSGEADAAINGSLVLKSGSNGYIHISDISVVNDAYSPIVVEDGVVSKSALMIMWANIKTNSETYPAIDLEANTGVEIWSTAVEAKGTGILLRGGSINFSGCDLKAGDKALEISQSSKDYPISANVSYESFSGKYAIYEKDTANQTGRDQISITADYFIADGKIYSENCKGFIRGGNYQEDVTAYVDPAYVCKANEGTPVTYEVEKREKADGLRSIEYVLDYGEGTYEDAYYYTSLRDVDVTARINKIQDETLTSEECTLKIKVDNDVPVKAAVRPNTELTVKNMSGNQITPETGCTLTTVVSGDTAVYTVSPAAIDKSNILIDYTEEDLNVSSFLEITCTGKLTGESAADNKKIADTIAALKDELLSEYSYNQYTAAKELKDSGISVSTASDIKIVVRTYFDTDYDSTGMVEGVLNRVGLSIEPKYHVYITTAKDAASVVTSNDVTKDKAANAVEIDPQMDNGFEFKSADGSNLTLTLKVPLPREFCTSTDISFKTLYYPNGMWDTRTAYIADSKIIKSGNEYYAVFDASNGLGYFEFVKDCKICYTATRDGKTSGYEYLSSVLSGEAGDQIVYLTEDAKNLTEQEKAMYLTGYLYQAGKVTIDKSAAPETEFVIEPLEESMVYTKSVDGNLETYNVYDLKELRFNASSTMLSNKNVKVTAKADQASQEVIDALEDAGYTFKYLYYRSTKPHAQYKYMLTPQKSRYINTYGKKGTRYYYKVRVQVYDPDGNLVYTTPLTSSSYAKRIWQK